MTRFRQMTRETLLVNRLAPLGVLLACLLVSACVTTKSRSAYSVDELVAAAINDKYDIRFFPRKNPDYMVALGWQDGTDALPVAEDGTFDILALSGGGPDGAYGAGALKGMEKVGSKPHYEIVTGVSTGALLAPFVFAGPDFDDFPSNIYTSDLFARVLGKPNYAAALGGPSLYSDRSIPPFLNRYISMPLIRKIAEEHAKGRRLLIATSNLDARDLTVWNMGLIATRAAEANDQGSLELFRKVVRAAFSIPGALPPVEFVADFGGKKFTELHGDAGVQAYFYGGPELVPANWRKKRNSPSTAGLDVILHNQIEVMAEPVEAKALELATTSVSSLTRTSMRLLLDNRIRDCDDAGMRMRYTYLPREWQTVSAMDFNTAYMRKTYRLGEERATSGTLWEQGRRK
ncbi:MAG: patatin-like phospholipase family protein [Rhizobiaceae bacterium]